MSEEIVSIATFGNPIEAEMAKNELEAAGIPAYVQGGETASLFGGGAGLFGSVRLFVAENHRLRALVILDGMENEPEEAEEPEPTTDIKAPEWKRATADADPAIQAKRSRRRPDERVQDQAPEETESFADHDGDDSDDDEEAELAWRPDDYAVRAWRAAILGLFLLPPLLHFYSAWLLMQMWSRSEELSPSASWKASAALFVDALAIVGFPFLYLRFGWI
ncbi:MAG: DUF2007 domain-containing protein [Gemmataceae bacterium]|nr:DUF2007 domain-containing protein [Gemmataceae bacterium]